MERLIVSIGCSLRRFVFLAVVLAVASCEGPMDGAGPTGSLVPGAVAQPTLTPGHQQLTVSWTAPASPVGVVAYKVRWKPSAQGWANAEVLRTVSGPNTITGLTNGTRYDVQVVASSARGDGPWSPSATAAPAACVGKPAPTRTGWSYPESEASDFTDYELNSLAALHAAGWNGDGVQILILDQFNEERPSPEHSKPSHGTGVADIARRYAPNATFVYAVDGSDETQPAPLDPYTFFVRNRSVSTAHPPDVPDRLPIEQSGSTSDLSTEGRIVQLIVLGGGNVGEALPGGEPARAAPAIEQSGLVAGYAGYRPDNAGDDFRPIGFMHAKSGLLVVGAVDHRPDDPAADGGWVLSHDSVGHSVRAGAARNAFLVAPDDNRRSAFSGTSFAAPRVTGAAAVLRQMCPTLTPAQIGYVLLRSARDLGEPGIDAVYGYGLLDLENALREARDLMAGFDDFDSTIPAGP